MELEDLTLAAASQPGGLDHADISAAVEVLLDETVSVDSRAKFLETLHDRGETVNEVAGFARELLLRAVPVPAVPAGTIDVCGTGGDQAGTFNVSTAVMFVAAGAGAKVAKHGNRAITSKCGAADVLVALGVPTDLPPDVASRQLTQHGCTFFFAPHYHPAVKAVAPVRKFLAAKGKPSIFNLLGPLINPARPDYQLVGLYDPAIPPLYARVLSALGRKRAWAVHGSGPDGFRLDEISTCGPTLVCSTEEDAPRQIDAVDFGLPRAAPSDLAGGDAAANAAILTGILEGTDQGPRRDLVCLNTAAALVVSGLARDLKEGLQQAKDSIDSGAAATKLRILASPLSTEP